MSTSEPEEREPTSEGAPASDAPSPSASEAGGTPEVVEELGAEVDPHQADEVAEPAAGDEEAERAAADVMLEADAEAEGEPATVDAPTEAEAPADEVPAPTRSRPARTRRRQPARREPGQPLPEVRAHAKYVRTSARKARLVCDHIRGKSVEEARAILAHTPRAVARDWSKLLESAVANAEHNHELVGEDLRIKAVHADEGPTIKRFRPRAMGRATRIRKRTSHLTILLTPKE